MLLSVEAYCCGPESVLVGQSVTETDACNVKILPTVVVLSVEQSADGRK